MSLPGTNIIGKMGMFGFTNCPSLQFVCLGDFPAVQLVLHDIFPRDPGSPSENDNGTHDTSVSEVIGHPNHHLKM